MKTILVPTDFSVTAQMASQYAAALAKSIHAQLILLHTYHLSALQDKVSEKYVHLPQHVKQQQRQLDTFCKELAEEFSIKVKSTMVPGLAGEEIPEAAKTLGADLVVMGTKRKADLSRNLLGSITTAVISRSSVPVLVIPEGVVFEHPKAIVLATDFQQIPEGDSMNLLKMLLRHFQAQLQILHVHNSEQNEVRINAMLKLESAIVDVSHCYETVIDEDTIQGIEQYLVQSQPDLLVMLPHRYSLFERIFHQSYSRYMALHASLPVLMLPSEKQI